MVAVLLSAPQLQEAWDGLEGVTDRAQERTAVPGCAVA